MRRVAGAFALLVAASLSVEPASGQKVDPDKGAQCGPEAVKLWLELDEIDRKIQKLNDERRQAESDLAHAEFTLETVKLYKQFPEEKPIDFDLQAEEADAKAAKQKAEEEIERIKSSLLPALLLGRVQLKEKIAALEKCPAPAKPGPAPEPANVIDACLVGKWQAAEGYRVTFLGTGKQILDYTNMKPFIAGKDRISFSGNATGEIATENKVAVLKKVEQSDVKMTLVLGSAPGTPPVAVWDLKDRLGPGGLGGTTGSNTYVCTDETLSYEGSVHRDKRPNFAVKLTRVKE